ncbi:MAG TPA: GlsB/YeaQ/YmgE family stress response membrane protein [Anaerolineales bacterium]|nr:GlsB/YeaQ/YmgE family stress response membrane protein [Anaerolineales bacterium]
MNFIIWLIAGAVVGWVASNIMGTNRRQGLLLDIVVGIVGAFVAGYFLSPYFGVATINQSDFSMPSLLLSLGGAVILLAVVNVLRRGRVTG